MQVSGLLHVRRLLEWDAPAYFTLRRRSIDELIHPIEPEVLRELGAGSAGMAALLSNYTAHGTQVWGAFVDDTMVGAAALSREYDPVHRGVGVLWGVFVLPRYRGTPTSRLLMDAITGYCAVDSSLRQIVAACARENVSGLQFLGRFGFDVIEQAPGCLLAEEDRNVVYLRRPLT